MIRLFTNIIITVIITIKLSFDFYTDFSNQVIVFDKSAKGGLHLPVVLRIRLIRQRVDQQESE